VRRVGQSIIFSPWQKRIKTITIFKNTNSAPSQMCIIGENLKLSQSMIHDSWYSDKEKDVKIPKDRNGFGFVVVSRNENGNFFHRVGCIIEQTPASRFAKLRPFYFRS